MQEQIMSLIIYSGEARSYAMEAIAAAKEGKIEEARGMIVKADEQLDVAHNTQTSLIQTEAGGNKIEMSLLMVHAQDHFMTSMVLKDLANELIDIHAKF